jgi:hypothetical protein
MRIMQPRTGFLVVSAALLATGLSSMALAAQNQPSAPACYGTCASSFPWLTQASTLISFGHEELQVFHVTVGPTFAGRPAPTGTVVIKSGSTILCTIVLTARGGSCSPSPDALPPGFQTVRGYYSGDSNFAPSVSNAKTFKVSRFGSGD